MQFQYPGHGASAPSGRLPIPPSQCSVTAKVGLRISLLYTDEVTEAQRCETPAPRSSLWNKDSPTGGHESHHREEPLDRMLTPVLLHRPGLPTYELLSFSKVGTLSSELTSARGHRVLLDSYLVPPNNLTLTVSHPTEEASSLASPCRLDTLYLNQAARVSSKFNSTPTLKPALWL